MYSRRIRSRGGYLVQVPADIPTPELTINTKVYSIDNPENISQHCDTINLTVDHSDLYEVQNNYLWSPALNIIEEIYANEDLRPIYYNNNIIKFIEFRVTYAANIPQGAEININRVDISRITDFEYLNNSHLIVYKYLGTKTESYVYPIPLEQNYLCKYKSLNIVETYIDEDHQYKNCYTGDLCYNINIGHDNKYIEIPIQNNIEELFTKYVISYSTNGTYTKFKPAVDKTSGHLNYDTLETVTI